MAESKAAAVFSMCGCKLFSEPPASPPHVGGHKIWGTPPNPWQEMSLLHLFVKLTIPGRKRLSIIASSATHP